MLVLFILVHHSNFFICAQTEPESNLRFTGESSVTLKLGNINNLQYYIQLSIGSPPQHFNLTLALATSWLWIPAEGCGCKNLFNSTISSTYTNTHESYSINYISGGIHGSLSKESIALNNLTVQSANFLLCYNKTKLNQLYSDGVIGLGFSRLSNNNPNFVENLKLEGIIKSSIFSLYLPNKIRENAVLTIGDAFPEKYSNGSMIEINVDSSDGYWVVSAGYIGFGRVYYNVQPRVIIDSGSSLITGQGKVVNSIKYYLKDRYECHTDTNLYCKCTEDDIKNFPYFYFGVDGNDLMISPENYLQYSNGTCRVLIESSDSTEWVLGIPFLNEYYSVFDMENSKMYIYPQNPMEKSSLELILVLGVVAIIFFLLFRRCSFFINGKNRPYRIHYYSYSKIN